MLQICSGSTPNLPLYVLVSSYDPTRYEEGIFMDTKDVRDTQDTKDTEPDTFS